MIIDTRPFRIDMSIPPHERVHQAYARIRDVDRPEVWITLRPETDAVESAHEVARRHARGDNLPLFGVLVAVKDNIDVTGLPTTAGCPEFTRHPSASADAVDRLIGAGAIVIGKTNLDQFATGLVGTRSPYGAVRCAWDETLVSGGSSSGSATAVALGVVDIALGTDTAGSGRVPAALNGLVGIKPTLGLVPASGVVPACIDYETVTVFAHDLGLAAQATSVMTGFSERDSRSRAFPADVHYSAGQSPRVAVPHPRNLASLVPEYAEAFDLTIESLSSRGIDWEVVDVSDLLDAATLLYDGAIVAQRYSAVGKHLESMPTGADPTVSGIILNAKAPAAHEYVDDLNKLAAAKQRARDLLDGYDGLVLPTTTEHPAIAAVEADPVGINRRMGTFTNFCNLLDMTAVAIPGHPTSSGAPFGVMVVTCAFQDHIALEIAARLVDHDAQFVSEEGIDLFVVGAHMRGEPLHHQLSSRGARFLREAQTSTDYRLVCLDTSPKKPGLIRDPDRGASISGEVYRLAPAHLGTFLAELPHPMALGPVDLDNGEAVVGFSCALDAAGSATDITSYAGWRAFLAASEPN